MRRARKIAIFLLLNLVLALTALEVMVRVKNVAPDVGVLQKGRFRLSKNPLIGYELIPDLESSQDGVFYDFQGKSNRLGFRDIDHEPDKPEGVYRIIVLGDSITQGLGIRDNNALFSSVLERELAAAGVNAEVLNFGVSGYNTQQEVETLREKGLAFKPDLVVLAYCLNDTQHVDGHILRTLLAGTETPESPLVRLFRPLLLKSAFYRFIRYRVIPSFQEDYASEDFGVYRNLTENSVEKYFHVLAGLAHDNAFQVLVTVFPMLDSLEPYAHQAEHQTVEKLSEAVGFCHLDLLPALRSCGQLDEIALSTVHPSPRGHACAGKAIAGEILKAFFRD